MIIPLNIFYLILSIIIAVVLGMPHPALAGCTASDSNLTFSPVSIQQDAAVGTVIATASTTTAIKCDNVQANGEWRIALSSSNSDYGSTSLANVRKTNNAGIGIRWTNTNSATGTVAVMSSSALNNTNTYRGIPSYSAGSYTFTDTFELIKIGPTNTGILPSFSLAYDYRTSAGSSLGRLIKFSFINTFITQTACAVKNSSVNVPMRDVQRRVFTGIGSTSSVENFSISLNCDAQVNPNITINATADSSGATGVIALDSGTNTAVGVGIQILRDNTPMVLGSISRTSATLASGNYNIDLKARYYQTMTSITPGKANGTATFTMTYN